MGNILCTCKIIVGPSGLGNKQAGIDMGKENIKIIGKTTSHCRHVTVNIDLINK